jgi:two-component system OmpR family response regulator
MTIELTMWLDNITGTKACGHIPHTAAGDQSVRVLLIEDDKNVAGFVIKGLREAGHNVIHADCAQVGRERAVNEQYDVIILDRILPDAQDGLNLLTSLRAQDNDTPVLILSGLGEAANKISGLKAGCDDYLAKPFAFAELLARIEGLARRGKAQDKASA